MNKLKELCKQLGFVSEVIEERVACYLRDRFICTELYQVNITKKEQDIRSISINNNLKT